MPSYTMARNNHSNIAYPKPFILFSFESAILKAKAVKINVRKAPVISKREKSQMALDLKIP